ncbi:uncharacterized protein EI90DRAFT_3072098 [Cantharellus anzutake]|uniref:uncharacterized protein n=1 Tax=Cantharellus anzutake TaxID=1750568 RepID=UPI0019075AE8|nr:uncharacterized protein EI90DRAFT_3072098 [Cantharellus anzutake]KAF8325880.1 hypothetical protein EI90DRAFT_3072098 [Cantharellus anzutake]
MKEARHSILILYRKLREGIMSSKRVDAFATQVCEESTLICIIFGENLQASHLLAQLVNTVYSQPISSPKASKAKESGGTVAKTQYQDSIIALYLLDLLVSNFSAQGPFISMIKDSLLKTCTGGQLLLYFETLSLRIRRFEYVQVHQLLQPSRLPIKFDDPRTIDRKKHGTALDPYFPYICQLALSKSIVGLRNTLREHSWSVLRHSYRDFSLLASSSGNGDVTDSTGEVLRSTEEWLSRRLFLTGDVHEWFSARPNNEVICENVGTNIAKWKLAQARK